MQSGVETVGHVGQHLTAAVEDAGHARRAVDEPVVAPGLDLDPVDPERRPVGFALVPERIELAGGDEARWQPGQVGVQSRGGQEVRAVLVASEVASLAKGIRIPTSMV